MIPAVKAFPEAKTKAALTVASVKETGTAAVAALSESETANAAADIVIPRRANRLRNISRARDNREKIVPVAQPSCCAASSLLLPIK